MSVSIADDAVLDIGKSYLRTGPVRRWEALHEPPEGGSHRIKKGRVSIGVDLA
jgi:hypothetical protein